MVCLQCEMVAQQIGFEYLLSMHTSMGSSNWEYCFLCICQCSGSKPNWLPIAIRHLVRPHHAYTIGECVTY